MAKKTRVAEESMENMATINKNVPESKFQATQQVASSMDGQVQAGESDFVPKKKEIKGAQLKQETVSELVRRSGAGGSNAGDGMTFAGRGVSGDGGNVLGAANQTPVAGHARSDSRLGKKLDRNTTKLNYIPNDQYITEVTESKPLAENKDADQGYNGTYRNEFARLQKTSGAVPGDLMFDRDTQLISRDELYFGQGQQVHIPFTVSEDALTVSRSGVDAYGRAVTEPYETRQNGNFLTASMDIAVQPDGQLEYMGFDEVDLTPDVDPLTANKASVARTCLMNDAEIVREMIDSKAGDEKADIWSPLARAVQQPTQTVGFLRDVEAEVGNEIYTAYRKASSSFAFQLNRAHLDGQDAVGPAMQFMAGMKRNDVSAAYQDDQLTRNIQSLFTRDHYTNGDASLMIALYDSPRKYTTKADFLVQPRGLRMHLQTADNNMDAFHMDRIHAQAFSGREMFSTIDRPFDGSLPTCITDKAAVIHKISWKDMATFYRGDAFEGTAHGETENAGVHQIMPASVFSGLAGNHVNIFFPEAAVTGAGGITLENGVIAGNAGLPNNEAYMITITRDAATDAGEYDNYVSYQITGDETYPLVVDLTYLSAPTKLNANVVRPAYRGPASYSYSDLRNDYFVVVEHPLFRGLTDYFAESVGTKIRAEVGAANINIRTCHSTKVASLWSFMLCAATPYIQKARINSMRDVLYYEKNISYPFSTTLVSVSEASTKGYSNFSYTDYDHELVVGQAAPSVAISWVLPEVYSLVRTQTGDDIYSTGIMCPWYSNENDAYFGQRGENDAACMSMPSIRSGVRFKALDDLYSMTEKDIRLACDMVASFSDLSEPTDEHASYKYGLTTDGQLVITHPLNADAIRALNVMALPRQVGRYMVAPYGVLTPTYEGVYTAGETVNGDVSGASSYVLTYWTGRNPMAHAVDEAQNINNPVAMNVGRAENFTQVWFSILANGEQVPVDHGFVLSNRALFGEHQNGNSLFVPFVACEGDEVPVVQNFLSLQKAMWTRIQKLPFCVSPFDFVHGTPDEDQVVPDPYDMLYWYGLCGFRASDYRESVYNREKEIINQGMLFVLDPWISASPVLKEGAGASSVYAENSFA